MDEFVPVRSVAQLLLADAEQDSAACKLLSTGPDIGDAVVGFHAQHAVEKCLEAVLRGVETADGPFYGGAGGMQCEAP